jgi:hypothetical protein
MLRGFLGKAKPDETASVRDAAATRGLEVTEADPDTSWDLWDSVLAEHDSRFPADSAPTSAPTPLSFPAVESSSPNPATEQDSGLIPPLDFELDNEPTQPLGLGDMNPEQRKDAALKIVAVHHQRIANTIVSLWGYTECSVYINKLIIAGGDGMGQARIGFHPSAAQAMLVLADLHDQLFGAANLHSMQEERSPTGWNKRR